MLQTLHMKYVFLGPELRDFLMVKADTTLQEVQMRSSLTEIEDTGMVFDDLH